MTKTRKTKITAKARKAYGPDTKGEKLPEIDPKLSDKAQKARDAKRIASTYAGAPLSATALYRKGMPEFKNCTAEAWMILNRTTNTVTYANTYNGVLKASYKPESYTHAIKENVIAKKIDQDFAEVEDREEWPTWVVAAVAAPTKRIRKSK